jgi:glycosyltransferase involved in cell wall biosynthesis
LKFIQRIISFFCSKEILIFSNFETTVGPYGGGNQFIRNLGIFIKNTSGFSLTFKLKKKIDLYLIIDIRKGKRKKYSIEEILLDRKRFGRGKIVCRINDSNLTRQNSGPEELIYKYLKEIDFLIFNSQFICNYYLNKYPEIKSKPFSVILNSANPRYFYPRGKSDFTNRKIIIVTHHWSDNINKGYAIYYELFKFCSNNSQFEFRFIGRKFNESFSNKNHAFPILGPFKEEELGKHLRECDIYLTASINDSCPMHVLEGLACGLPIMYIDAPGGAKEICEMSEKVVGESFITFEDLIDKLNLIVGNYDFYYQNVIDQMDNFNSKTNYLEYLETFKDIISKEE